MDYIEVVAKIKDVMSSQLGVKRDMIGEDINLEKDWGVDSMRTIRPMIIFDDEKIELRFENQ